ncbi:uncharacterized protein LOC113273050 [Papaver somniferum]|uniref:uncharacterized protein LOC113273050 n=1 Tax=Papaver somniferum TaxID=3469 RepID=UPI000E6FEF48|nr:uncharacterized protein LOC113273050 [Papaver somniferum]
MHQDEAESSGHGDNNFPSKFFWRVKKVAPKIKTFIWSAIHNELAVVGKISQHVAGVPIECVICKAETKTVHHLLFECHFAQAAWFASPMGLRPQGNSQTELSHLMINWSNTDDNAHSAVLGMAICWAIWKVRNSKVFYKKTTNIKGTLKLAFRWFNLYYNIIVENDVIETLSTPIPTELMATWNPPQELYVKINVDAAWKDDFYACAAIIRDSYGIDIGASTRLGNSDTVHYAEVDGFLLATELALKLNQNKVIVEGDSQVVVNNFNGTSRTSPWRLWKIRTTLKDSPPGSATAISIMWRSFPILQLIP